MFTGIISEVGNVSSVVRTGGGARLSIDAPGSARGLRIGDSVSVNGACLTVVSRTDREFAVEAVEETLRKTTLGRLRAASRVNLELALRLSDRLGGHLVQGHVDGIGEILKVERQASSVLFTVGFAQAFARYVVPVGSIAIDGISLTVAGTEGNRLTVSIIPHTLANTTLGGAAVGDPVNLEFDLIGKYIEKMLGAGDLEQGGGLSVAKLLSWGYGTRPSR